MINRDYYKFKKMRIKNGCYIGKDKIVNNFEECKEFLEQYEDFAPFNKLPSDQKCLLLPQSLIGCLFNEQGQMYLSSENSSI